MASKVIFWLAAATAAVGSITSLPPLPSGYSSPGLPAGRPIEAIPYMVDNTGNTHNVAPDKGTLDKPVTTKEERLRLKKPGNGSTGSEGPVTTKIESRESNSRRVFGPEKRQGGSYWLQDITHGQMPFAPSGYEFFRNVKDYGAVGDGVTDDTEAINRAASQFSKSDDTERCGKDCGQTTTLGAMVYFPPGTYLISAPIIQYYYTQFVGDAANRPTIKGAKDFTGIALIDCDPYIPEGNGANWYINQNQFFRQIRNFRLDLTAMNRTNYDHDQEYAPTGIHWQVSQAASLQYIHFEMPVSDADGSTTAVGIFMENGSGGFLSDLTFFGGNIGFRAGSQQYTARNLQFTSCLTAISMIWDWGFTWQNIYVYSCWVAIDCTSVGGIGNQGTGSITVLDSHFNGVPYPITLRNGGPHPNIVLDNLLVENSASIVLVSGGETIFEGSSGQTFFTSWAMGSRCSSKSGKCSYETGLLDPAPRKPQSLLDGSGNIFARSKPTYTNYSPSSFVVVTAQGVKNDGTGDQADAINSILKSAAAGGRPVFFPSGVYLVEKTVFIPVGSIIIGEAWSQIMGTGSFFSDESKPQPVIRVGNIGDSGVVEISDMLWTVKGGTAGAILMQWNVHESTKGSAAMWDCHFRVGGAVGTDLRIDDCPKSTGDAKKDCIAASMLFHVTARGSGYFENVWVWTADHDMDVEHRYIEDGNTTTSAQINVYTARGTLIESQGPTWLYGTGSEHHVLYQYQIQNAKDVFLTHIQTETPYYQAGPDALKPFKVGSWSGDPDFGDCSEKYCKEAWGLRVRSSSNVLLYTAGLYSFFQEYDQACLDTESCQERLAETSFSEGLWFYNIFTKGGVQVITPRGGIPPLMQKGTDQEGFTTEVSAWLVLALDGGDLGGDGGNQESGSDVVYIDSKVFVSPSPTVACWPPCTLVWPSSTMSSATTIRFDPIDTTITIGGSTVTKVTVSEITTTVVSFFDQTIEKYETSSTFALVPKFKPPPVTISVGGTTTTVTVRPLSTSKPASTTTVFYSLGTTTTVSGGTTWTYSIDQITSLSTLDGSTSTTVTMTRSQSDDDDDDDDDIIIFPVWLGTGGFYWSPVWPTPLPTPPPKPPTLPKPPPVPTVPCFKLFGIFSIMCPPDKSKPTTTFKTGAPEPTCTGKCGTKDDGDDDDDKESSTCATATSTECHNNCRETPCRRVCNTYVGCSCPTQTVTNHWVSCSSTSCTTTSSNVVTGCYETGKATTTGDYCPLATADPNEDQGTDGKRPNPSVGTVTKPPVVIIGDNAYPVTSGSVYISGTWYGAPSVGSGSTITTTINGQPATVYPGTTSRGVIISTPPNSGPTPPPNNPGPSPTTTAGGGGGGSTPAKPTAYLEAAFGQYWPSNVLFPDNKFRFYGHKYGDNYDVCDATALFFVDGDVNTANTPYPDGSFKIPSFEGNNDCVYVGKRDAAGTLNCAGFKSPVKCFDNFYERLCYETSAPIQIWFKARCEWGPDQMSSSPRLPSDPGSGLQPGVGGGCGWSTSEKGKVEEECPVRPTTSS
ncbi:hypothetical protein CkaCkLH20_10581 [Colletotrichum karsti]|uniref:Rhamnogalacturonase A/B/Epimerase-like pectate lyase domain-containing protein n=1 Tax=Colletotrichum karsti TaxID=1095194 RepID=A0A9P6LDL2_9PEZI|nr:uncharacterized protein CkaCkLH20_10581 [Colletotrichum karsti]KAF9871949.1 hypothetical protein CkaCkLH20_10581 [Colletotrichum karsti]